MLQHIRDLKPFLAALVGGAAALVLLCSPTAFAASLDRLAAPTRICSSQPMPPGWVIVDSKVDWFGCGGIGGRSETITPASGASMTVCIDSPVPSGWVVTRQFPLNVTQCTGLGAFNTKLIVPVTGQQMIVCGSSPLPANWVIVDEETSLSSAPAAFSCPLDAISQSFSSVQETITPAFGNAMTICANSPVPIGYITEQLISASACHANYGRALQIVAIASQEVFV